MNKVLHEIDAEAQEQIDRIYATWKNKLETIGEASIGDIDLFLKNCDKEDLLKFPQFVEKIHSDFQQERRSGIHYRADQKVQGLFQICEDSKAMVGKIDAMVAAYKEQAKNVECKLQIPRELNLPIEMEKIATLALPKRLSYNNLLNLDIAQAVSNVLDKAFNMDDVPVAALRERHVSLETLENTQLYALLCRRFVVAEVEKHDGERRVQDRSGKVYGEPLTQIQHYGRGFRAKNVGIEFKDLLLTEGSMITFNDGSVAKMIKLQQYTTPPLKVTFNPKIGGKPVDLVVSHQMHLKDFLGLKPTVTPVTG